MASTIKFNGMIQQVPGQPGLVPDHDIDSALTERFTGKAWQTPDYCKENGIDNALLERCTEAFGYNTRALIRNGWYSREELEKALTMRAMASKPEEKKVRPTCPGDRCKVYSVALEHQRNADYWKCPSCAILYTGPEVEAEPGIFYETGKMEDKNRKLHSFGWSNPDTPAYEEWVTNTSDGRWLIREAFLVQLGLTKESSAIDIKRGAYDFLKARQLAAPETEDGFELEWEKPFQVADAFTPPLDACTRRNEETDDEFRQRIVKALPARAFRQSDIQSLIMCDPKWGSLVDGVITKRMDPGTLGVCITCRQGVRVSIRLAVCQYFKDLLHSRVPCGVELDVFTRPFAEGLSLTDKFTNRRLTDSEWKEVVKIPLPHCERCGKEMPVCTDLPKGVKCPDCWWPKLKPDVPQCRHNDLYVAHNGSERWSVFCHNCDAIFWIYIGQDDNIRQLTDGRRGPDVIKRSEWPEYEEFFAAYKSHPSRYFIASFLLDGKRQLFRMEGAPKNRAARPPEGGWGQQITDDREASSYPMLDALLAGKPLWNMGDPEFWPEAPAARMRMIRDEVKEEHFRIMKTSGEDIDTGVLLGALNLIDGLLGE